MEYWPEGQGFFLQNYELQFLKMCKDFAQESSQAYLQSC